MTGTRNHDVSDNTGDNVRNDDDTSQDDGENEAGTTLETTAMTQVRGNDDGVHDVENNDRPRW